MQRNKLFVFFGLIASGKSTAAKAWADRYDMRYYNSDVVRKELAGLSPSADRKEAFNKGIYSKEFSERTYTALLDHAATDLSGGKSVVLDASYQNHAERGRVVELAKRLGARLYFILCVCPEEEMRRRMGKRALDPNSVSDGRWEVYLKQKELFEPPQELSQEQLLTLNTDMPVDDIIGELENSLKD